MIVVIDNYDSFTYNLVQQFGEIGAEVTVFRNDQTTLDEIEAMRPSHIVVSPGPGTPSDGGISSAVIERFGPQIPVLGICLGHQCIGEVFGGNVIRAPRLMHGKTSNITHYGHPLFDGVPSGFEATRYHSLVVETPLPPSLRPIAHSEQGELMGLCHDEYPIYGLQFHPESILTAPGRRILANFMATKRETAAQYRASGPSAEVKMDLRGAIRSVIEGKDLTEDEAEMAMDAIMGGEATPAQIGSFITALRLKGETIPEIVGCARSMRNHVTRVTPKRRDLIDTCGTGGDLSGTFNISTTVAFVIAGAGLGVAKHGNRSVSSRSGSADVLEALGVNLDLTADQMARAIDEVGIGFLFAPKLHPAMRYAIGPRREIGVRTIFNILGPLTNPAGADRQLLGVYSADLVEPLAKVLRDLGCKRAMVVHGADGLDELSTTGSNEVASVSSGQVSTRALDPTALGLTRAKIDDLRGGDPVENARMTRAVLSGECGPRRDAVLLNAAAALVIGEKAEDMRQGIELAARTIDSGAALECLEALIAFTNDVGSKS